MKKNTTSSSENTKNPEDGKDPAPLGKCYCYEINDVCECECGYCMCKKMEEQQRHFDQIEPIRLYQDGGEFSKYPANKYEKMVAEGKISFEPMIELGKHLLGSFVEPKKLSQVPFYLGGCAESYGSIVSVLSQIEDYIDRYRFDGTNIALNLRMKIASTLQLIESKEKVTIWEKISFRSLARKQI